MATPRSWLNMGFLYHLIQQSKADRDNRGSEAFIDDEFVFGLSCFSCF